MLPKIEMDAEVSDELQQLEFLKTLPERQLCGVARSLDWKVVGHQVMSWISAQRNLDLGTAVTLFFNADPQRLNHAPREMLNMHDRRVAATLDALCQRINCGYYLPDGSRPQTRVNELALWLRGQEADEKNDRKGRWILDASVVAPLNTDMRSARRRAAENARAPRKASIINDFFRPLIA